MLSTDTLSVLCDLRTALAQLQHLLVRSVTPVAPCNGPDAPQISASAGLASAVTDLTTQLIAVEQATKAASRSMRSCPDALGTMGSGLNATAAALNTLINSTRRVVDQWNVCDTGIQDL